jgi:hypothetical protein
MEVACASKMSESSYNITVHKSWEHEVWFLKLLKQQPYFNHMFPQNTTAIVMYVKKKKSNRFGLQTAAPKISDQF